MVPGSYVFQLMSQVFCDDAKRHMREFASQGYTIKAHTTLTTLMHHISTVQDVAGNRVVIVIDGRDAGSATAVSTLRSLPIGVGIVALVDRDDDAAMLRLLQMGADICSFVCAPPDLWVATVSRLLWRLGQHKPQGVTSTPETPGTWTLIEQGWAMLTPAGHSITLTTGERAFMMTLLNAPLKQATHEDLISAVNASYNYPSTRTYQSRLGVMVSRMRRKFMAAGVPLPLKSIHNWGYMFVTDS